MRKRCRHKESKEKSSRERETHTKTMYWKIRVKKRLQRRNGREGGERQRQEDGAKAGTDRSETIHFR